MKRGLIVRLIDVVFILLMGFITASDIIRKTQIKIPDQTKTGNPPPGERPLLLRIAVRPTREINDATLKQILAQLRSKGKRSASEIDKKTQKELSEQFLKYIVKAGATEDAKEDSMFTVSELETYIIGVKNQCDKENKKLVVAIIPHPRSMVQGTVNIFDICRRYRIEYTFRYFPETEEDV